MFEYDPRIADRIKVVDAVNRMFEAWNDLNIAIIDSEEVVKNAGELDPYLEKLLMVAIAEHDHMSRMMGEIAYRMDQLKTKGVI